jgi:hypothetical protein
MSNVAYELLLRGEKLGLKHTIKKLLAGQPMDWHLPSTIGPDETIAKCARCSVVFVIGKPERRTLNYCNRCK